MLAQPQAANAPGIGTELVHDSEGAYIGRLTGSLLLDGAGGLGVKYGVGFLKSMKGFKAVQQAVSSLGNSAQRVIRALFSGGGDDVVELYHATSKAGAQSIRSKGIDLAHSNPYTDFGHGFYTGSSLQQVTELGVGKFGTNMEVLTFRVKVSDLQKLKLKVFDVPGDDWAQFVRAGREGLFQEGLIDHGYDVVQGPILKNLTSFMKGASAEPLESAAIQASWHSKEAFGILQKSLQ